MEILSETLWSNGQKASEDILNVCICFLLCKKGSFLHGYKKCYNFAKNDTMLTNIIRIGNSQGILLGSWIMRKLNLKLNSQLDIVVSGNELRITPISDSKSLLRENSMILSGNGVLVKGRIESDKIPDFPTWEGNESEEEIMDKILSSRSSRKEPIEF